MRREIENYQGIGDVNERMRMLRAQGRLGEAIELCERIAKERPSNYFYPKILGDLYFQEGDYDSAAKSYIDFLVRLPAVSRSPFADFAKRYYRLKKAWPPDKLSIYAELIMTEIQRHGLSEQITTRCRYLIMSDLPPDHGNGFATSSEGEKFVLLLSDDAHFERLVSATKRLERQNPTELIYLLDRYVLNRARTNGTFRIDSFCISIYEKAEKHENALKLAEEMLSVRMDANLIRSFFRLSRKSGSYARTERLLEKHPEILRQDAFPVLYELVYYFEAVNRFEDVRLTLGKMERGFRDSAPIQKTLRNFYIRFGMVDDAKRVERSIAAMRGPHTKASGRFSDTVQESEFEIGSKIKELYSEVEHQRRLAAISDLTTGISHELGQPITNIRYTIQFYRRQFEREITRERVLEVFDSVLEETERMGSLMKRLSPITSSRSVVERFDLVDRIRKRVQAESVRLQPARIRVTIKPSTRVYLDGDPVKFDQLISNLVLNSLDAIREKGKGRNNFIEIVVQDYPDEISIWFTDNGVGIPARHRGKIFDPFFSTKPPGNGEGLGLFIVWNLLKMQGGRIALDPEYNNGARFIITMPKEHGQKARSEQ
jgi:signal transduction histidine kinase